MKIISLVTIALLSLSAHAAPDTEKWSCFGQEVIDFGDCPQIHQKRIDLVFSQVNGDVTGTFTEEIKVTGCAQRYEKREGKITGVDIGNQINFRLDSISPSTTLPSIPASLTSENGILALDTTNESEGWAQIDSLVCHKE